MTNKSPTPLEAAAIQMAHYALAKVEAEQGFHLDWREKSNFIKNYVADFIKSNQSNQSK